MSEETNSDLDEAVKLLCDILALEHDEGPWPAIGSEMADRVRAFLDKLRHR